MSLQAQKWAMSQPVYAGAKCVLLELAWNANDNWPACNTRVSTLARKLGCTERAVQYNLAFLESGGLIARVFNPGRTTLYELHLEARATPRPRRPGGRKTGRRRQLELQLPDPRQGPPAAAPEPAPEPATGAQLHPRSPDSCHPRGEAPVPQRGEAPVPQNLLSLNLLSEQDSLLRNERQKPALGEQAKVDNHQFRKEDFAAIWWLCALAGGATRCPTQQLPGDTRGGCPGLLDLLHEREPDHWLTVQAPDRGGTHAGIEREYPP
jgi:hypothetical protein